MIVNTSIIENIQNVLQDKIGKEIEPINNGTHKVVLGEGLIFRIFLTNTSAILIVFRPAFFAQNAHLFGKLLNELADKIKYFSSSEIYVIEVDREVHPEYPLASLRPRLS